MNTKEIEMAIACENLVIAMQNETACERYERKWSNGNKQLKDYVEWLNSKEATSLFYGRLQYRRNK